MFRKRKAQNSFSIVIHTVSDDKVSSLSVPFLSKEQELEPHALIFTHIQKHDSHVYIIILPVLYLRYFGGKFVILVVSWFPH